MAPALIQASAPGKLLILGEHAVVHGRHCLVAAVNQRLTVTLTPREDRQIIISSALGRHETTVDSLADDAPSRFVIAVLRGWRDELPGGCELAIRSDFTDQVGLGSSAAVTAATLGAVATWCGRSVAPGDLLAPGLRLIRQVQGNGSGADLAASLYGGVLLYRCDPLEATRLAADLPLTVVYSGTKVSTSRIIRQVDARRDRHPAAIATIFDAMGTSACAGAHAIRHGDWAALGELCDINQGLMAALGVSSPPLEQLAGTLREAPGIHGAKLSGAGLGDCLIGIGRTAADLSGQLALSISPDGLRIDS